MTTMSDRGASAASIQHHYDVSDQFYSLWLDGSMTYSCGLWQNDGDCLSAAQMRKIDYLVSLSGAGGQERVLDIGWLRTGDVGVIHDGELFILGRIKDALIVDGRNHYPDDIEATIQSITGGRAAAIAISNDGSEQLVAIVELKKRAGSDDEFADQMHSVKREVTAALSRLHGLRLADLVLVAPGSIPITTSGKVRRSACAEQYRLDQFSRLGVAV